MPAPSSPPAHSSFFHRVPETCLCPGRAFRAGGGCSINRLWSGGEETSMFHSRPGCGHTLWVWPPCQPPGALTWGFSARYLTNLALFGSCRGPQGGSSSRPRAPARCWALQCEQMRDGEGRGRWAKGAAGPPQGYPAWQELHWAVSLRLVRGWCHLAGPA